ncbi:MAG: cell wall biosynthesis glycosyltransferase [uncultured bacterium]|nr:MAG: cell wall biosynthesis glycosyltransferase [uncultured bacterium]KKT75847.1 MAG: Glycosyl transferase family 2 [Candidatus Peregrinibacteria bacterium GW2011_GWA2_44_7]
MKISAIIPTHNRSDILGMCLEALEKQTLKRDEFEVIVVNDGSNDTQKTEHILKKFESSQLNLQWFTQPNAGQGIARNKALKKAKGKIVIFLNDDIIGIPTLLEEHWKIHTKNPQDNVAVLGFIDWHPDLEVNEFMQWMVNGSSIFGKFGGHQFAFEKLKRGEKPNYNFFYTSNLSLKRKFLGEKPFDENFSKYGWEDIDLGYRLEKERGLKIIYNDHAIGHHYHPMDEESLGRRMEMIGKSAHLIDKKHPELHKVPSLSKKLIFHLLSNPLSLFLIQTLNRLTQKKLQALYYYALSKKHFLKGINQV